MTPSSPPPDRAMVIAMLARYDGRTPDQVGERIDSLELAWLVHELQSEHAVHHDFGDAELVAMGTVDGAVAVLREVWTADPAETL
jgi:hypothetical protein